MGHSQNHAHLEENESHGKTASHPAAVRLDFALENENQGYQSCHYPCGGLRRRRETERPRRAYPLLKILNVVAEWRGDENTTNVDPADDAMQLGEAAPQAVRELHWGQQQGARSRDAVGQQVPPEGMNVLPFRTMGVD